MLQLGIDQINHLSQDLVRRDRLQGIARITSQLRKHRPAVLTALPNDEAELCIAEVMDAANAIGIFNIVIIANWCLVRLLTGLPFYKMPEFNEVLQNKYLHPDARGRHIVMAYFALRPAGKMV